MKKNRRKWMLSSGIFLLFGIVAAVLGMYFTGFDFIKWIKSPEATTLLIFLIIGVIGAVFIIVMYRLHYGRKL